MAFVFHDEPIVFQVHMFTEASGRFKVQCTLTAWKSTITERKKNDKEKYRIIELS